MKPWAWHPTAIEELLLAVAIGPAAGAAEAFAQWRAAQPLDTIDEGTLRLLPLLVPRLLLLPAGDAAWPIIRGTYRRAFFRGNLLARCAADVLARLALLEVPTLLLKGGALLPAYDNNPALRPMNDFDVLVPHRHAERAIAALLAMDFVPAFPHPERLPTVYHGACFTSPAGLDIDLHWQPLPSAESSDDARIWRASLPTLLHGAATRVPCAADLLTIVCAHAALWSPVSPVRWVADALRLLAHSSSTAPDGDEASGAGFDWERVLDSARAWHVTLPVGATLAYLRTRWAAEVPPAVLHGLASTPVPAVDRHAYRALCRKPGLSAYLLRPWRRYRLRSRERATVAALPGFVRYLQVTLAVTMRGSCLRKSCGGWPGFAARESSDAPDLPRRQRFDPGSVPTANRAGFQAGTVQCTPLDFCPNGLAGTQ